MFATLMVNAQEAKVTTGKIQHFANFKSEYVESRNIDVWVPNGYSNKEKYAVLYMHDGQMLFDATTTWNKQEWEADETAGRLIEQGKTKKFIIVGISNINGMRHSEFFPQKPFESLPQAVQDTIYNIDKDKGRPLFGGKISSDNYLKFIVTELKPFIDKNFSTKTDAANTVIAGSSMGGLISMYAICEYPDVFGGAACISTHWPGTWSLKNNPIPQAFFDYFKNHLPSKENHKIYFDCGDQDLDKMYPRLQKRVDYILNEAGFTDENWMSRFFGGKNHSEKAWAERLHIPLEFLLKK
ncbi:alpha/beta hydrolase [Flavobacterium wongokense]|uniref:alpha/beta hydrolase n=1 Tax=Flavobacterium wongokense TaxID=2910674 RepID=UPI001EEC43DA|nr:alpha/beta hydrolase-fold protein [Flavobacterium sp. WG47]MCF6132594.1 esterase [Flavobacterium sp. WG47]